MKKLNDFFAWLYIMFTVVVGIFLVLSVSGWLGLRGNAELAISGLLSSSNGLWAGLLLIIIGLLLMALRIRANTGGRSISFDNPEGEVTISIKAVEDFVRKIGNDYSQVLDIIPTVLPARDGVKIVARTTLMAGINVPRLAETIQREIKTRMQNVLGIENVTGVEVNVSKLVAKEKAGIKTEKQNLEFTEVPIGIQG